MTLPQNWIGNRYALQTGSTAGEIPEVLDVCPNRTRSEDWW